MSDDAISLIKTERLTTSAATSVASTPITGGNTSVRVVSTTDAHVSTAGAATINDAFLPANQELFLALGVGQSVNIIAATVAGVAYVTEVA